MAPQPPVGIVVLVAIGQPFGSFHQFVHASQRPRRLRARRRPTSGIRDLWNGQKVVCVYAARVRNAGLRNDNAKTIDFWFVSCVNWTGQETSAKR